MRKVSIGILMLIVVAPLAAARSSRAASTDEALAAQNECALDNPAKGQSKFTGEITGGPTGTLIEVTSENESLLVVYNNSVLVCLNGQIASANALSLHATVVVYGPTKKKGKSMQMTATKILVAGSPRMAVQTNAALYSNNSMSRGQSLNAGQSNSSNGSVTATDNWNAGAQGESNGGNSGSSGGSGVMASQDNWQALNTGSSKSQNSGGISCNALQFSVSSQDSATGMGKGRSTASAITCRMLVGQLAMQLMEYAATGRRLGNVTLNWQGQISAALMNADVSSVQFTSDSGNQVVDVTFAFQRAEITHLGSGARVTF